MLLTNQQMVAIQWPCLIACECLHPRYKRKTAKWSVVLTVNSGYE